MPKAASKPTSGRTRAERLETRVTAEQKTLIERAAALQGRSVTDFVLTSVQDAARRAIEEHSQLALSVRDSEAFVDALLKSHAGQRSVCATRCAAIASMPAFDACPPIETRSSASSRCHQVMTDRGSRAA